jgi:hypothetical protein
MEIKARKGYLFWAVLAFILSAYGFADALAWKGGRVNPIFAGLFCFALGLMFLYFYFTSRQK